MRGDVTRFTRKAIERLPQPLRTGPASMRALPDFILIGAQKTGTSSLHGYLAQHPDIEVPSLKELHFFDADGALDLDDYRNQFPFKRSLAKKDGGRRITGEATPIYLFDPRVPGRVAEHLPGPGPKLIVLLRDPAERAWSHFQMTTSKGQETLPIMEALAAEDERLADWRKDPFADQPTQAWRQHSYVARGRYAEQLERWLEHFPAERLLVLRSEDLFADPSRSYRRVADHLGVEPYDGIDWTPRNVAAQPSPIPPEVREWVDPRVADDQAKLGPLLASIASPTSSDLSDPV